MIAYIVSQNHDVIAFQMWKTFTKGRLLWVRNTASTLVSQAIDTFLFVVIAFSGLYSWDILWSMIFLTYTIKALAAIADTPLVYLVTWYLKNRQETNSWYSQDTSSIVVVTSPFLYMVEPDLTQRSLIYPDDIIHLRWIGNANHAVKSIEVMLSFVAIVVDLWTLLYMRGFVGYWAFLKDPDDHTLEISYGK